MIFVDTGAWFASVVAWDANHAAAAAWLSSNHERLVSTDYVLDETLTLLRARNDNDSALAFGYEFFQGDLADLIKIDDTDVSKAWDIFRKFSDKDWSFTDCTSKVIMERLGVTTAFAFDQHFRQFGTVQVVP